MSLPLVKQAAMKLPKSQRLKLASALIASSLSEIRAESDPATAEEIERRAQEAAAGKTDEGALIDWNSAPRRRAK